MFNPFVRLDSALLGAAQKFCDEFQRLTGYTKFRLQKWATIAWVSFCWLEIFTSSVMSSNHSFIGIIVINTFSTILNVWSTEKDEKTFLANAEGKLSPSCCSIPSVRIISTVISLPGIILASFVGAWAFVSGIICFVAWIYFSACVPRPPSKSKMREWLNKALWRLNDALAPAPALVPISNR